MLPISNFSFTMLVIAVILVCAGAPLLPVYVACGVGAVWQFLVAVYAGPPEAHVALESDYVEPPEDGIGD